MEVMDNIKQKKQTQIPNGWVVLDKIGGLGKIFNGLSGKTKVDFGEGEPYIPYVNVFKNSSIDVTEFDLVKVRKGEYQNKVVYGDIIFTTSSETIEEVGMTSVFLDRTNSFYLNSFCFCFRLNDFNTILPEFARYLFRSDKVRYAITLLGQGSTRYNLSKTRLLTELKLSIPKATTEQRSIASILSKTDEAITNTEVLIAKYIRIKTGLMQDLLTKGIDESGNIRNEQSHEFKDSPLGKIPKEWECEKLSSIIKVINGGTPATDKNEYWHNGEIPWLSVDDFNNGRRYVYDTTKKITQKGFLNSSTNMLKPTEIIISARGTVGVISQMKFNMAFNQSCYGITTKNHDKISNDYLYYALIKIFKSGTVTTEGSVFSTITVKTFDEIFICFPHSSNEINKITDKLGFIDEFIEEQKTVLVKLQSLKTGLMQDLLTGKVRVEI